MLSSAEAPVAAEAPVPVGAADAKSSLRAVGVAPLPVSSAAVDAAAALFGGMMGKQ